MRATSRLVTGKDATMTEALTSFPLFVFCKLPPRAVVKAIYCTVLNPSSWVCERARVLDTYYNKTREDRRSILWAVVQPIRPNSQAYAVPVSTLRKPVAIIGVEVSQ